jgi:hypothetical protein
MGYHSIQIPYPLSRGTDDGIFHDYQGTRQESTGRRHDGTSRAGSRYGVVATEVVDS